MIDHVLVSLDVDNLDGVVEVARLVGSVRGYESVKEAAIDRYRRALADRGLGAFAP